MSAKILIILVLPAFIVAQTPCQWQYVRNSGQIQGVLQVAHNNGYSDHHIRIYLSVGARFANGYVGDISLVKDKQNAINDIKYGKPVQYRIRFPIQSPLPKLTELYYNNQLICSGQKDIGEYVTTIILDHTIKTATAMAAQTYQGSYVIQNDQNTQKNSNSQISQYSDSQVVYPDKLNVRSDFVDFTERPTAAPNIIYQTRPSTAPVVIYQTRTTSNPAVIYQTRPTITPAVIYQTRPTQQIQISSRNSFDDSDNQCGVSFQPLQESNGLITNGRAATKGQFPWLAAYYHNGIKENGFICGGSLISAKAVITAAHCIHPKNDEKKLAEEALFYIGKHYIQSLANEKDFVVSPASQFIIHPEWNYQAASYDADIAIATLTRTIHFTNFIRPICLWTGTNNYHDLINHYGVIAGYGKTHLTTSTSDKPYWTALPIVDEGTCLRSNNEFTKITSKRTFCVGGRDGRGPCNGDSGGGLIIRNNGHWYLRGVVSASLFDKELFSCDTNNFAVFTDVAAFKDWIQQNI